MTAPSRQRGPRWDEVNQRASFYVPVELLRELDAAATAGISKSQIVTAALDAYLHGRSLRRA